MAFSCWFHNWRIMRVKLPWHAKTEILLGEEDWYLSLCCIGFWSTQVIVFTLDELFLLNKPHSFAECDSWRHWERNKHGHGHEINCKPVLSISRDQYEAVIGTEWTRGKHLLFMQYNPIFKETERETWAWRGRFNCTRRCTLMLVENGTFC